MKDYKKIIPNLLTIVRIVLTPIMIVLSLLNLYTAAFILALIAAITDLFDGKLARYWNTTSLLGAKLDAISDKVFAIGLVICLIPKYKSFLIIVILEVIIGLTNLYYHYKTNNTESLKIGKFKTVFLFTTIVIGYFTILNNSFINFVNGFKYVTINLQFLSIIFYFKRFYYLINKKELTVEDSIEHQKIMLEEDKTIKIDNLTELIDQYEEL